MSSQELLPPNDIEALQAFNEQLRIPVQVGLKLTPDQRSRGFKAFGTLLNQVAPKISFYETSDPDHKHLPAFQVTRNIVYHAIPNGPELTPFLDLLTGAADHAQVLLPETDPQIVAGADIRIFITPFCPRCPRSVGMLLPLALADPAIHLAVIDGMLFEEMAQENDIRAVPTVLLDRDFRWSGTIPMAEIQEALQNRDLSNIGAATLRGLLEAGNARQVAILMQRQGRIFPAFIDLLTHAKWPVRLGSMVALEFLTEAAPELGVAVTQALCRRYEQVNDQVKGDILYMLGENSGSEAAAFLESVLSREASHDVHQSAKEALETLKRRLTG